MTHALKTIPEVFTLVLTGEKTFEIRSHTDRPFQINDLLIFQEWKKEGGYTGREIKKRVTHIFTDAPTMGLKRGFSILSLGNSPDEGY